jgi:hypothetical protein
MEQRKGKIVSITKKKGTSQKGAYTLFSLEMDNGQKYTTFDKEIGEKFLEGQNVVYTVEKDGPYWKLKDMALEVIAAGQTTSIKEDRDKSIIAQCLTKCVAEGRQVTKEEMLETYKWFLKEL